MAAAARIKLSAAQSRPSFATPPLPSEVWDTWYTRSRENQTLESRTMPTPPCKRRWQTYTWRLFRSMFDKERSCHPLLERKKAKKAASSSNGIQENGRAFHHYGTPKRHWDDDDTDYLESSSLFAEGVQQLEHLNVVVCTSTWFRRAWGLFPSFLLFFLLLHFSDTQDTSLHIVPTTLRFLEEFTKEEEDQKLLESRPIDTQSSMHMKTTSSSSLCATFAR